MSGNTWHLGLPDTGHWRRGRQTVQLLFWSAWQRAGLENTGWKHTNLAVNQCSYVLWTGKKRKVCWKKRLPLILLMSSSFNLHQPLIVTVPLISYYQLYYHVERRGYSKKVMGECLPKGQLAVEPAANQRLVAKAFLARWPRVTPAPRAITRKLPIHTFGGPAEACQGW